ncbi:MAG: O-methyltransferase [Candidatus Dormibacteraceae bacterium]
MNNERWGAVDSYLMDLLTPEDPALTAALEASQEAGLPQINVSPVQGQFLHLLARALRARNILEIGTLGGYSTIWLARALSQEGRLVTLEMDPEHAAVARGNFERAGLSKIIELRLGAALETLPHLASEGHGNFDLIFIDADKPNIPEYFKWALKLSHRGTLIIIDNVIRQGSVADAESNDPTIQGVRRLFELIANEPRVSPAALQTVGNKGYDGFAFALVTTDPE